MSNVTSNLKTEMAVVTSLILDEAKNGKKIHLVTVDERRDSSAFPMKLVIVETLISRLFVN